MRRVLPVFASNCTNPSGSFRLFIRNPKNRIPDLFLKPFVQSITQKLTGIMIYQRSKKLLKHCKHVRQAWSLLFTKHGITQTHVIKVMTSRELSLGDCSGSSSSSSWCFQNNKEWCNKKIDTSFHTVITKQERIGEENLNETWKPESSSFNFKAFQSDHTYCQHGSNELCHQ